MVRRRFIHKKAKYWRPYRKTKKWTKRKMGKKRSSLRRSLGSAGYGSSSYLNKAIPIKIVIAVQHADAIYNDNKLSQTRINMKTLLTNNDYLHFFKNFEYYKVRGISIKGYSFKGPTWGNHGTDDIAAQCNVNNIAWNIPNTVGDVRKFSNVSAYQDPKNLPPSSWMEFINDPGTTRRLSYWDKPTRIYTKSPHWIERYKPDPTTEVWADESTSALHRHKWHSTGRILDAANDTIFFGGSHWMALGETGEDKDIRWDSTVYLSFKKYRNTSGN